MPNTQEETTLILLKPDCVRKNLSGTILKRFLSEGFRLRGIKMIQLDEPVLREHYAHSGSGHQWGTAFPEAA